VLKFRLKAYSEIDNGIPMSRIIIGNTVYMYQRCRSGSESGGTNFLRGNASEVKLCKWTGKWGGASFKRLVAFPLKHTALRSKSKTMLVGPHFFGQKIRKG
jgi:hypothetical protein